MEWNDATSYSRNGDRTPHWWETRVANLRVSVGDQHVYHPKGGTWLMNCSPWFDRHVLKAKTEAEAKEEALHLLRLEVQKITEALTNG